MRCDNLFLWYLGEDAPRYVGALNLVASGKGVSLRYGPEWLSKGFPLSEDLPLEDAVFLPAGRLESKHPRAAGAVDDARPDRWGEKVIRFIDKPDRMSLWGTRCLNFGCRIHPEGPRTFASIGGCPDTERGGCQGPRRRVADRH